VSVAVPEVTEPDPSTVAPFINVTVPVAPAGTVAVKVAERPYVEGLTVDVSTTLGDALFTVTFCVTCDAAE
jgi:hypothetical protein